MYKPADSTKVESHGYIPDIQTLLDLSSKKSEAIKGK